jgi:hypothetical protein
MAKGIANDILHQFVPRAFEPDYQCRLIFNGYVPRRLV